MNSDSELLYGINAERNFLPASLQKVLTNFAALEILGEDYQFTTQVAYTGEILPDGNLTGDLVIHGNGDPSLGSERYQKRPQIEDLLRKIKRFVSEKGITCIDGEIICDASFYGSDGTIHSWSWNDIGNYYACNTWSINLHENYYKLFFQLQNNREKQPKIISHDPWIPGLDFKNELTTGAAGSGDQSYIFGAPYTYQRFVRGSLPQGNRRFRIKGAMPNAPLFLARLLSEHLDRQGISNAGASVEFDQEIEVDGTITSIKSPKLRSLVTSANLESINLYCESFLAAMGRGSRDKGISEIKEFLSSYGIDSTDIRIDDGSGLSFWNYISASDLTKLLVGLNKKYGDQLTAFFPRAGKTGTLSYLFRNMEAYDKLWAKTGSMQQVMNYAGFTRGKSGRLVFFCIIANRHQVANRKIRSIHEELMNAIYING